MMSGKNKCFSIPTAKIQTTKFLATQKTGFQEKKLSFYYFWLYSIRSAAFKSIRNSDKIPSQFWLQMKEEVKKNYGVVNLIPWKGDGTMSFGSYFQVHEGQERHQRLVSMGLPRGSHA